VEFVWEMFPTKRRLSPLYILEDHSQLRILTSNSQKNQSILPFALNPTSHDPFFLSRISMRFSGILGGLADPRATLLCPLLMGSIQEFIGRKMDDRSA